MCTYLGVCVGGEGARLRGRALKFSTVGALRQAYRASVVDHHFMEHSVATAFFVCFPRLVPSWLPHIK